MNATQQTSSNPAASDEELLHMLAEGQQEALGPLYSRYAPLIFAQAARSLDGFTAEEIVQDVLLTVWRAAGTYDSGRGAARPWIMQIARYRIINELRKRRSRPNVNGSGAQAFLEAVPDPEPDPAELVWRREHAARLHTAVEALPDPQREAVSLAYFAGLTHEEVASTLQLPLGTAKTRIRSALQKLRVSLAPAVAAAVLLLGGLAAIVGWQQHRDDAAQRRDERALALVTASDITNVRLTATAGNPANVHATYRGRAGSTTAVVTFAHFAPLPKGKTYQVWALHDGEWISLATARPDAHGGALLIVEGSRVTALPEAMEVTVESAGGSQAPTGPVVTAWAPK